MRAAECGIFAMANAVTRMRSVLAGIPWRRAIPPRSGWLRLFASPLSYIFAASFLLTAIAKTTVLARHEDVSSWLLHVPWAVSNDAFVYFGLAAHFAAVEARLPAIRGVTFPLAGLIGFIGLVNAWYLSVAGWQLNADIVSVGIQRLDDTLQIAGEQVSSMVTVVILVLSIAVAIPIALRYLLFRTKGPCKTLEHGRERAHCALAAALLGGLMSLVLPTPLFFGAQELGSNAAVYTYWTWATQRDPDNFVGYDPPYLVSEEELGRFGDKEDRPNILIVILESIRYDHTSLAPPDYAKGTATPNLSFMAKRGTSASYARAVVPHTTKSIFAVLCGRYPLLQTRTLEQSDNIAVQCLPRILSDTGYRTAFFQSARGTFEFRPRVVEKLGYQQFSAWEDIQGEPVGYFSSDDESLAPVFSTWLDAGKDTTGKSGARAPFMVTILTSTTHHPYRLPERVRQRVEKSGTASGSDEENYARLVESQDHMLGALLKTLDERGLRESTIVVALGDHGEGFGHKGVGQHDANAFEEGLHVPLVFSGPGVPQKTIEDNVTLADVTPTLMGLLGLRLAEDAKGNVIGMDILSTKVPRRVLYFSCWFETVCEGFVIGREKVIYAPQMKAGWYFDLAADSLEKQPREIPFHLRARLPAMHRELDAYRAARNFPVELGPVMYDYHPWQCTPGRPCTHPNARPIRFDEF